MKGEKGGLGPEGPPGGDGAKVLFIYLQHYSILTNIIYTCVYNLFMYFRGSWGLLEKLAKLAKRESRYHA